MPDLQRRVPCSEHREVVLVEVGDRLGVMGRKLLLGDLIDPRVDELAEQLPARLAADGLGDHPDRVLGFDEAEGHSQRSLTLRGKGRAGR
jgi:hypothetical protein